MKNHLLITLIVVLIVVSTVVSVMMNAPPLSENPSVAPTVGRFNECCTGLIRFSSHKELLDYLSRYLDSAYSIKPRLVTPIAIDATRPVDANIPSFERRYSRTNVQVKGIDEPDIVKTNGYLLVLASENPGNTVWVIDTEKDEVTSRIALDYEYVVKELLLINNTLVILARRSEITILRSVEVIGEQLFEPWEESTAVFIYDLSIPNKPKQLFNLSFTGQYLSSRLFQNNVYVVSQAHIFRPLVPRVNSENISIDRIFLLTETPGFYVVIAVINVNEMSYDVYAFITSEINWIYMSHNRLYLGSSMDPLHPYLLYREMCSQALSLVPNDLGRAMKENLDRGDVWNASTILLDYVRRLNERDASSLIETINQGLSRRTYSDETRFYVFDVKGGKLRFTSSFVVKGRVLDQFSMEEYMDEYFIVATTSRSIRILVTKHYAPEASIQPYPLPEATRELVILPYPSPMGEENNVYLVEVETSTIIGRLEGLAKGERVYSSRLVGRVFYLVTFRNVDPLFAIDVSNPYKPEVLGYIKTPGFSEYLHPLGPGRLLGIGLEDGGLKISVFNVSDPTNISEVSKFVIPSTSSEVLHNHRAFTIDTELSRFHIPIQAYELTSRLGEEKWTSGIAVFSYHSDQLELIKIIGRKGGARAIRVEDKLYVVTAESVEIYNVYTLDFLREIELHPP